MAYLKQPLYSPDFNLMNQYIFRNNEVFRRQVTVNNTIKVEAKINDFMDNLTEIPTRNEFEQLKIHLNNVIEAGGNYI